ncbi:hypothetical protein LX32DRAFT_34982 [Colletotrichum zoysiae]|uniref:Uncharacterized protein n=1 Tax=Colletotrichum zoysiae TaxID=1216348 RepID=A0AAD9HBU3_9PEZI|nr:hypothetical protein LX32DRAFT_34982 [Colletotrichum zoysiae]
MKVPGAGVFLGIADSRYTGWWPRPPASCPAAPSSGALLCSGIPTYARCLGRRESYSIEFPRRNRLRRRSYCCQLVWP